MDLLSQMLQKSPTERISAEKALQHPYFKGMDEEEESKDTETLTI